VGSSRRSSQSTPSWMHLEPPTVTCSNALQIEYGRRQNDGTSVTRPTDIEDSSENHVSVSFRCRVIEGAGEKGYDRCVQTQSAFELNGTLDLADMTRFQYFHSLRRTWPIAVFAALVMLLLVPILALTVIANPESDWRTILTNALPFFLLLLFWLFFLGVMPRRNARKQLAAQLSSRAYHLPLHLRDDYRHWAECALEYCLERLEASSRDEESLPAIPRTKYRCCCAETFLPEPA
jgi:hypothetical protein